MGVALWLVLCRPMAQKQQRPRRISVRAHLFIQPDLHNIPEWEAEVNWK